MITSDDILRNVWTIAADREGLARFGGLPRGKVLDLPFESGGNAVVVAGRRCAYRDSGSMPRPC
jgi:hypothetical protein